MRDNQVHRGAKSIADRYIPKGKFYFKRTIREEHSPGNELCTLAAKIANITTIET